MVNSTMSPYLGACVPPFLDVTKFPSTGGFVDARLCMAVDELPGRPTCCLPCPATDWLYPDSFKTYSTVAEWINVFGLCLLVFMLISFAILPVSKTRSHYLSICLIVSIAMVCIGFIVPLGTQPEQCYNEITPNDMFTSLPCAFSGAFIVGGCLCATVWITVRALSMNLQIVWDIIPGRKFLLFSQVIGWGVPAGFFAATMAITGVSYRFGNACHVNHKDSLAVFWGPLLAAVAIAGILQLWTFGHCIKVYLRNLWSMDGSGHSTTTSSNGLPSYNASLRAQTARAVFNRLKKVLFLQWRGLGIVSIILVDVIFCSVVFVRLDRLAADALGDFDRTKPWLYCLVAQVNNDKTPCLPLVNSWLINIETIEAVLFILAFAGLQCFIMMTRPSFFVAWYELFHRKIVARREFRKIDPQAPKGDVIMVAKHAELRHSRTFEMQKPAGTPTPPSARSSEETDRHILLQLDTKVPSVSHISSPAETYTSPYSRDKETLRSPAWHDRRGASPHDGTMSPPTPVYTPNGGLQRSSSDYFRSPQQHRGQSTSVERRYVPSAHSFSGIRPPSRQSSIRSDMWEARELYSRGGLGLSAATEVREDDEDLHSRPGLESRGRRT